MEGRKNNVKAKTNSVISAGSNDRKVTIKLILPADVYKYFRMRCMDDNKTMGRVVQDLISAYVSD